MAAIIDLPYKDQTRATPEIQSGKRYNHEKYEQTKSFNEKKLIKKPMAILPKGR